MQQEILIREARVGELEAIEALVKTAYQEFQTHLRQREADFAMFSDLSI
jgi:hypothetical protein